MHWEISKGVSESKVRAFCKKRGIKDDGTVA
jgi:hypothetical protein